MKPLNKEEYPLTRVFGRGYLVICCEKDRWYRYCIQKPWTTIVLETTVRGICKSLEYTELEETWLLLSLRRAVKLWTRFNWHIALLKEE